MMYRSNRRPMNRSRPARPDVFAEIVRRVPAADAARAYGVSVDRRGLALCPFHAEDTPSCRFYPGDRGFYCFGCGTGGDVIKLVEKLFGITPIEAARKLDSDFHLGLFDGSVESATRITFPEPPERAAERELNDLRKISPQNDPAAYGAAQGRIAYLEYYLEEVRECKLMEKQSRNIQQKNI